MVTGSTEVPKEKKLNENYLSFLFRKLWVHILFSNEIKREGDMKAKLSFVHL